MRGYGSGHERGGGCRESTRGGGGVQREYERGRVSAREYRELQVPARGFGAAHSDPPPDTPREPAGARGRALPALHRYPRVLPPRGPEAHPPGLAAAAQSFPLASSSPTGAALSQALLGLGQWDRGRGGGGWPTVHRRSRCPSRIALPRRRGRGGGKRTVHRGGQGYGEDGWAVSRLRWRCGGSLLMAGPVWLLPVVL